MKGFLITLIPLSPLLGGAQVANTAILTLVEEGNFNKMAVRLESALGNSTDTSTLSGTMNIRLNIDPATGESDEFTILSADISGSDLTLAASSLAGSYSFSTMGLAFDAATPADPVTMEARGILTPPPDGAEPPLHIFEANQHVFVLNGGTLSGTVTPNPFLGDPFDVNYDYSANPSSGAGTGQGTVLITPTVIQDRKQFFTIEATIPVSLVEEISIEGSPLTADTILDGEVKALGTTFVDLQTYSEWALAQGLGRDSQAEFSLSPEMPNEILFILGFKTGNIPGSIFTRTPAGFQLMTNNAGKAKGNLEIQWSADLETWARVSDEEMVSGSSLITEGLDLETGITAGIGMSPRYYRISGTAAP